MSRGYVRLQLLAAQEKAIRKEERSLVRDIAEAFQLPENEFLHNYKVSKDMISYLCDELDAELAPRSPEGYPLLLKVIASLKILLDGHYQRGNGNEDSQCIGQTTVSKYLQQFVAAVNASDSASALQHIARCASGNRGVSIAYKILSKLDELVSCGVIVVLQWIPSHIGLKGNENPVLLKIADCEARLLNVNANNPGQCHDQFIFNRSFIKAEITRLYNGSIGQYSLLGDAGYALEPWLMTPIRDADPPEGRYSHIMAVLLDRYQC